jgi:hypothetical protein
MTLSCIKQSLELRTGDTRLDLFIYIFVHRIIYQTIFRTVQNMYMLHIILW